MSAELTRRNWQRLLYPRSVALLGASETNISAKYVFENMRRAGFKGAIYPVNPRHAKVFGQDALATIADAPDIDVAIVLLGRERVEQAVMDAVAAGVGGIIVVTGGFRETGETEWVEAERRMAAAVKAANIPMIGPNCLGVMALPGGAMMQLANYPWPLRDGSVALIMQSGGQLLAACRYVNFLGGGVRWGFSVGNGAAASFADMLAAVADDPDVREVVMLIEEIGDWTRFREAVERARAAGKWIVAIAIGRTETGRRAAALHTGAAAVDHEALCAGLAELGIRVGETLNATLGAAVLHSRFGEPAGGGIGIAGVSGGGCGLAADHAAARGARLAMLAPETVRSIESLNPEVRADNPIDIVGGPLGADIFRKVFETFLRDKDVAVGLYLPSQGVPEDDLPGHVKVLESVADAADAVEVPVVISTIVYATIPDAMHRRLLARKNVCVLPTIEEALASLTIWQLQPAQLLALNRRRQQPFRDDSQMTRR